MNHCSFCLFFLLLLAVAGSAAFSNGGGDEKQEFREKLIERENRFRRKHGLDTLTLNQVLTTVAQAYAEELARFDRGLSHVSYADGSEPPDRISRAEYDFSTVGENLYRFTFHGEGVVPVAPAEHVLERWKSSKPHRDNILSPEFTEAGIGVARSPSYKTVYYVQVFASPGGIHRSDPQPGRREEN